MSSTVQVHSVEMLGYPIDYGYVEGRHTIDMTVTRSANDEPGPYSARETVRAFVDAFATMLADGEDGLVLNEKFDVGYVIGVSGETYIPNTGSVAVKGEYVDAPYVGECPLVLELALLQSVEIGSHVQFIGEVKDVKVRTDCLDAEGKPDVAAIDPLLFAPVVRQYWSLGNLVGEAFSLGQSLG